MSKTATYHQTGKPDIILEVIKDHKNGTLDLGRDGIVLVSGCAIADVPENGSCSLVKTEDPKAALKASAKAARTKATQLSKAATEAAKAADAGKGKEGHEALVKAAVEASEAAKAADTEADAAEEAAK